MMSQSSLARRIEKGDHPTRSFDVVGADMLGNATEFTRHHLGAPDVIEQRGLAVIDVSHHGHHRRPRLEHNVLVRTTLFEESVGVVELGGECLVPHLLDQNHRGFLVQHLIDGDHRTHFHQGLDQLNGLE